MSLHKDTPLYCARNNKNGKLYYVLGEAVNCNNSEAHTGEPVVVYTDAEQQMLFTRNKSEFEEKFTRF